MDGSSTCGICLQDRDAASAATDKMPQNGSPQMATPAPENPAHEVAPHSAKEAADSPGAMYSQDNGQGAAGSQRGSDYLGTLLQASNKVVPPGKGEMRHGTEGWRSLETSFKVPQQPPA